MAGGPRPRQPRFTRSGAPAGEQQPAASAAPEEAAASAAPAAPEAPGAGSGAGGRPVPDDDRRGEGARTGSTRVRVNSQGKVAALDAQRESEFEPVPTGGGRFSDWRRTLQLGAARSGPRRAGRDGGPDSGRRRMRPGARRALIALIAAAVALVIAWAVLFSPLFAVRSLEVEGVSLSDRTAVEEALEPLRGTSMTRISDADVRDLLSDFPAIRGAETSAGGSGTLRVAVQERIPVAAVEADDGWSLVDRDGVQLEQVAAREEVRVPVIDGGTDVLGTEDWETVGSVLATLPSSLLEQVQTARAESGGVVMLELEDGVTVRWGDDTESALKAEVLAALVGSAEETGGVEVYDVSAPRHPVLE